MICNRERFADANEGADTISVQRPSLSGYLSSLAVMVLALASQTTLSAAEPGNVAVGDRAIDFDLPVVGSPGYLSLREEYKQGPVVLIVLRGFPGYQCPICTQQVGSLINRAKALAAETHRVILVYPGEEKSLQKRADQFLGTRRIPAPLVVVRDEGMKMVGEWGLRWQARKETAYPATYIIDRYGRVQWKQVSQSHAGRSSVQDILKELRKL